MNKNKKETKPEKKHVCQDCGASFLRPYRLTQHLLLHNNIKTFVCGEKDCNKSYTSKSHLDRHINSVHIKPDFDVIYRCPECMKLFSNRQNLKRHIKIKHLKKVKFTCDVCKTSFKKKHLLSTHMYYHTYVKSFSCVLCNKDFISLHDRKRHMKYHKTYNCENCDMAFDYWSKYIKHRRTEHRVNEFNCNDCGRKFKMRSHMVHHVKTHVTPNSDTPKVFSCWFEDCGRVYSRHSNLKQHIRIKHLQETFACEICEAQLATKAKLRAHLQTHCKTEVIATQAKTKLTGRKDRKDKGSTRGSAALKIAGLIIDPDINLLENDASNKEEIIPIETEEAPIKCDLTVTAVVDSSMDDNRPSSAREVEIKCEKAVLVIEPIEDENIASLHEDLNKQSSADI